MDNYAFIEKIGKGTHGTVYLLKDSNDKNKYAVCKTVTGKYKNHAYREIAILNKLNHRRIVNIIDNLIINDNICIILEYINYGSVESMIHFFTQMNSNNSNIKNI